MMAKKKPCCVHGFPTQLSACPECQAGGWPCPECGLKGGRHEGSCYHSDCDQDDWAVHGCGPMPVGVR